MLPGLCIWLAYLLPAHSMAGLYSYSTTNETGVYLYIGLLTNTIPDYVPSLIDLFSGYMLLYLTVLQMLSLFVAHLLQTKTASSILLILFMLAITSVGGYAIHIGDIPRHLWWSEMLSPERWLLPVIVADEYSAETLSNTAGQQLCRNKQVKSYC